MDAGSLQGRKKGGSEGLDLSVREEISAKKISHLKRPPPLENSFLLLFTDGGNLKVLFTLGGVVVHTKLSMDADRPTLLFTLGGVSTQRLVVP